MKLLYIYSEFTIKGGADRIIIEKANYFVNHGYSVTVVTESQLGREIAFPLDLKVKHIDVGLDFNSQYRYGMLRRGIIYYSLMKQYRKRLTKLLSDEKPDIVITTMGRNLDFITDLPIRSVIIGEAHTTKAHLRGLHLMEQRGFLYKWIAKYQRQKMSKAVSKLGALVLLTNEDANTWKEAKQTYVIPNAIPFFPEKKAELENRQVIMVGRYNDAKGYDYLIPAWEKVHKTHADWILNVYGSGEMHNQVVEWINERQLNDSIVLHEPTDDIMEKYMESSICVLSSRYEGFSMVLVEAMACGVPCVSFNTPYGPRHIIHQNEDGLLVNYLDVNALADGLCRLIEDVNLRKSFGDKARQNIKFYSQENVMGEWMDLFAKLTKK